MANQQPHNQLDLGIDRGGQKNRQRTINPDGSYNMERIGERSLSDHNFYHWIITTTWKNYFLTVILFYICANIVFATGYYLIGVEQLSGMQGKTWFDQWLYCFFFSAQSFTTVGYGGIHPIGKAANFLAITEAFTGLMTFVLATGTLFGRFAKPVSRIKYSKNIIIAPYKNGTGLMFICANKLRSQLMEMEAQLNISWLDKDDQGNPIRKFSRADLEISKISMFVTSWVINHPVEPGSILYGKTEEEIHALELEVFVLLKGFDDAFSQTIYSRYSYMAHDLVYGAKFKRPFHYNPQGKLILDISKVGEYDKVDLPARR